MGRLEAAVVEFLEGRGWPVDVDGSLIRTAIRTEEQAFPCAVVTVEEVGQLVAYSVFPDTVGPEQRPAVTELTTRANAQLTVGNLEIDLGAGQVRFRTGLAVGQSPITAEMVERVIVDNVATAVAYFPLVTAVIEGRMSPAEAVAVLGEAG